MVNLVVFVNLFFVPVLPVYAIYRYKKQLSFDLLLQYFILTSCNIPIAKVIKTFCEKLTGLSVSIDSGYYTLFALFSAAGITFLYIFCKMLHIAIVEIKIERNEKK